MVELTHTSQFNEAGILTDVDRFIRKILDNKLTFSEVQEQLKTLYPSLMSVYRQEQIYTETINAFIVSTQEAVGQLHVNEIEWNDRQVSEFCSCLNSSIASINVEDSLFDNQEKRNRDSVYKYVSELTSHYQRLLVIRVDLCYQIDYKGVVDIKRFNADMNKFRDLISNKKSCFKHLKGYIWALEQGEGYHCHFILFYDGSRRQNDYGVAKKIGDKWIAVTEGRGYCFNCNTPQYKKKYIYTNTLGIGMIYRDQPTQVRNTINTALYLASAKKIGQRLKVKLPNMRSFGHGVYRTSKRRGLPPITN